MKKTDQRVKWMPISSAPKGQTVIVKMKDGKVHPEAHWASNLSGEEQPPFEGWFVTVRDGDGKETRYCRSIEEPVKWKPTVKPERESTQSEKEGEMSKMDSYTKPKHGWTCFHCGDTFTTPGAAQDHFGKVPGARPGCLIKVELGGERGLLMALRKAEEEIAHYMEEETVLHKEMIRMQTRHSEALKDAEETGYARGLRDAEKSRKVD